MDYSQRLLTLGNYWSKYYFECNELDISHYEDSRNCFSDIFHCIDVEELPFTFGLLVCRTNKLTDKNYGHRCFLNDDEIVKYIEQLQQIVDFEYTISVINEHFIEIEIRSEKMRLIQFKWLLTGLRNLYERSNSVVLNECFKLIEYGFIKTDEIISLFLLLLRFYNIDSLHSWVNDYICFPLENKQFKEHLSTTDDKLVNHLFDYREIKPFLPFNSIVEYKYKYDYKALKYKWENNYRPYLNLLKKENNSLEYIIY